MGSVTALGQQITDPNGHLADRVLEPVAEEVLEHRRLGRRAGTDAHPRPRTTRRHADALSRDRLRLAYNGVTLQAPEVERFGGTILYRARTASAQARVLAGRGVRGRLDGPGQLVQPLHGPGRRPRQRTDRSLPRGLLHDCPDPGRRARQDRPARDRSRQAAAYRPGHRPALVRVRPCEDQAQTILLPAPRGPWRVEVTSDTFVPAEVDPSMSDRRRLGVQVAFGFQPQ